MSARLSPRESRLRARRNARRDAASRLANGLGRRGFPMGTTHKAKRVRTTSSGWVVERITQHWDAHVEVRREHCDVCRVWILMQEREARRRDARLAQQFSRLPW